MECPKFVGSAYAWQELGGRQNTQIEEELKEDISKKDCNIIPKEITERIIDTILLRRDDFKVRIKIYTWILSALIS